MNEFCGCDDPKIETKSEGLTLVATCSSCGASVATTDPVKLENMPWMYDETEYTVIVSPLGIDRSIFVKIMKKKLPLSSRQAFNLYQDRRSAVAFKGKGQEFYEFCQFLAEQKATFVTEPECPYL